MTFKKKVLITGATGFIGRNMVQHFAANPAYDVHAVAFTRPFYECNNVNFSYGDLCDEETVENLMENVDILIQAAAVTSGCKDTFERPWVHVTDNAVMNSYLMRAAHIHKVKHVIFFSCSTMYPDGHVSEETPISPNPRYFGMVNTKLYIEKLCAFYSGLGNTKYTVIRGSNFYGPYDKFDLDRAHVFGATITKVMKAEDEVVVWGDGKEARDLVYIDDLVDFVDCALERQTGNFGLYNCGLGIATPIGELVDKIIKNSGKDIGIKYDTTKPSIPVSFSLDCSLAEKELGWKPKTSLHRGIVKTLEWYNDNF